MFVGEVMSSPAVTVHSSTPVHEVGRLMVYRGISALPVLDDDGVMVGIVSDADLLADRFDPDPDLPHMRRRGPHDTVEDIMTTTVESLTLTATLGEAAVMMVDENFRCVPVVDGRTVVGMVTRRDLLRVM